MIGHQWKTAHISVIMPATIPPRLLICLPFLFVIMLLLSPRDQKGEKPSFFWQKLNDSILDFRRPQLSVLKWSLLGGQVQLHFIWRTKNVIILSVKIFWRVFKVSWHPIPEQNRSCEFLFENSILGTFCAGHVSKQHLHHKSSWQRLFSFCDKGEERYSLLDFVKTWTQKTFPDWLRWKIGEPAFSVRHSLGDLPLTSISKLHEKNSEKTLLTCKQ